MPYLVYARASSPNRIEPVEFLQQSIYPKFQAPLVKTAASLSIFGSDLADHIWWNARCSTRWSINSSRVVTSCMQSSMPRRWHSILGLWRHRRAADYDEQSSDAHPETVASQTATVRRLFLRLDRSFTFFPGTSWVSTHETKDVPKSVRFPREDRRPHEDACLFRSGVSSVRESSEEILGIKVADGRDLPRPRRRYRYSGAMLCHPKYFPKFFSW